MEINVKYFNNFEQYSNKVHIVSLIDQLKNIDYISNSKEFRNVITRAMTYLGYPAEVILNVESKVTVTSIYSDTAVCLQLGNIARGFYDLLKLQSLFLDKKIYNATLICPVRPGGNKADFFRIVKELTHVFCTVISVPIAIIGLEKGE